MKEFDQLLEITDTLLGPEGCPWDREQTMMSTRHTLLEETCEMIEAIDLGDNAHMCEELGDLFFNAIFLGRLAEKEQRFSLKDALKEISEKLIRRHPHVWGDAAVKDSAHVIRQWEQIKEKETGKTHRKSALDGIPLGLPALALAQKSMKKMQKSGYVYERKISPLPDFQNEDSLGEVLLSIAIAAQEKGIDAEQALRQTLARVHAEFRIKGL